MVTERPWPLPIWMEHPTRYLICFCGGMIRFAEDGKRIPCTCGSTLTREEVEEAVEEMEKAAGW